MGSARLSSGAPVSENPTHRNVRLGADSDSNPDGQCSNHCVSARFNSDRLNGAGDVRGWDCPRESAGVCCKGCDAVRREHLGDRAITIGNGGRLKWRSVHKKTRCTVASGFSNSLLKRTSTCCLKKASSLSPEAAGSSVPEPSSALVAAGVSTAGAAGSPHPVMPTEKTARGRIIERLKIDFIWSPKKLKRLLRNDC